MIDPDKISKEKLAEMNDSLIVDNNHLRERIRELERQLQEPQGFTGTQEVLRYREPWRKLIGDNLIYWMGVEVHNLRTKNAALKEQVAQLERDKEYRYVEQVLRPIRILLNVAEYAESLADNSEEMEGEDGRIHVGTAADFDELSDALDLLDELPDDKPGYVLGGAAKAAWALRDIIGDTNAA